MNLNPAKSKTQKGRKTTECRKLRIEYFQETDCFCIAHYSGDGELLSEARLSGDDGLDYARNINECYDIANSL
jgi:hypothetical protein